MNLFPISGVRDRNRLGDGQLLLIETKHGDMTDFELRFGIATTLIWDKGVEHPGTLVLGPAASRIGAFFDGVKDGRVADLGNQWEIEAPDVLHEIDLSPSLHVLPPAGTLLFDENGPVAVVALLDRVTPCFYIFESKTLVRTVPKFSATLAKWDIAIRRGDTLHGIVTVKAE